MSRLRPSGFGGPGSDLSAAASAAAVRLAVSRRRVRAFERCRDLRGAGRARCRSCGRCCRRRSSSGGDAASSRPPAWRGARRRTRAELTALAVTLDALKVVPSSARRASGSAGARSISLRRLYPDAAVDDHAAASRARRRRGRAAPWRRRARSAAGLRAEPRDGHADRGDPLHAGQSRAGAGAAGRGRIRASSLAVDRAIADPDGSLFTCTPALDIRSLQQAHLHTRLVPVLGESGVSRVTIGVGGPSGLGEDRAARQPLQALARSLQPRGHHQRHLHLRGRRVPDAIRRAAARAHPRRADRRLPAHRDPRRHVDQPRSDRPDDRAGSPTSRSSSSSRAATTWRPRSVRELVDVSIYVVDVAGGDKVPRKGGPGVTRSDLLVINKTDLAPHVGADLSVMQRDATRHPPGKADRVHQPEDRRRPGPGHRMDPARRAVRAGVVIADRRAAGARLRRAEVRRAADRGPCWRTRESRRR